MLLVDRLQGVIFKPRVAVHTLTEIGRGGENNDNASRVGQQYSAAR